MDEKFWLYEECPGHTLNVIFSARTIAPGRFSMYKSAKVLEGARLYLNCASNTWYQNDIKFITDLIKSYRGRRHLRIVGISMGGYAAVVWGCMFPFAHTVAFSPNLIIDTPFTHSWYYKFNPVKAYANMLTSLTKRNPQKLSIFFGSRDLVDMYYYGMAKKANITGTYALHSSHSTAAYLENHGLLTPVINGTVSDEDLKRHLVNPDPDLAVNRFYTYCDTMRLLSTLSGHAVLDGCATLDRSLFNAGLFQKLTQDLSICGFIKAGEGVVDYCASEKILDEKIIERLRLMLGRSNVRRLSSKPVLPMMADEIDGRRIRQS